MPTDTNSEEAIFREAIKRPDPQERAAYVETACGNDERLRAAVQALLGAHEQAGSFLAGPAPELAATMTSPASPVTETAGSRIGRYKLLQRIGEGGFGVIYMAEQTEPVRRRVALKIIKLGMDTRQVIGRFEAERQALAMMDHPNIARVLDAGATETGRPYFVMELVRGISIIEYADQSNLNTKERLKLFVLVCHAVQHAHQKGIIHRDIKPSNVLVTLHDGVPVPKVIDFGIAKATEHRLTEKTVFTEFHQLIGTPAYMSPEQAALGGLDIDTRSDIYSLGVMLYQLLTGTRPFSEKTFRGADLGEIRRVIREDEPPRPSTRVNTLASEPAENGETTSGISALDRIAKHRSIEPAALGRLLRGDLDWIVMKALEKDRTRRYETANTLAMDIQRHLNDEPVVAGPPSRTYQLKKFLRRHRGLASAIAAVIAALVIGLGIATYALVAAKRESVRSRRVAEALDEMLGTADPTMGKGADYTVRAMLDDFAETLDGRFEDDPSVEATLRHTIGRAYFGLGLPDASEPHLRRAHELCDLARLGPLEEAGILTDLARTLLFATTTVPDYTEPEALLRKAIQIYRERDVASPEFANALGTLGWILHQRTYGRQVAEHENEGVALNREGIRILEPYTDGQSLTMKGKMCVGLAYELLRSGDPAARVEANRFAEEAVQLLRAHGPHHFFMGMALKVRALCRLELGMPEEAETTVREAVAVQQGARGTADAEALHVLATALLRQGKFGDALALKPSIQSDWGLQPPPMLVESQCARTRFLLGIGDFERAEAYARNVRQHSVTLLGREHMATRVAQFVHAQTLLGLDDSARQAEAQEVLAALLPIARARAESGHEGYVYGYTFIVGHLTAPAPDAVQIALDLNRHVLDYPLMPPFRLRTLYTGALVRMHAGETEEARAFLREILESPAAYTWSTWNASCPFFILRNAEDALAGMLLELNDAGGAEQVYRSAIARREDAEAPDSYQIILAKQRLARFLREQGKRDEAHQLLTAAQQAFADAPACFDWLWARVREDLLRLGERRNPRE